MLVSMLICEDMFVEGNTIYVGFPACIQTGFHDLYLTTLVIINSGSKRGKL